MPEIFEELDRQADKWEPTAAAISLGSLGLPLQVLLQEELLLEQVSYRWVSSWQRMVQDF